MDGAVPEGCGHGHGSLSQGDYARLRRGEAYEMWYIYVQEAAAGVDAERVGPPKACHIVALQMLARVPRLQLSVTIDRGSMYARC